MTIINESDVLEELTYFIRNADVLTISERSVATTTDEGTFASDSTHLIAVTNIKNIRSITVGGSPISFGTDYTYDINFDDSGTIKTKITFVAAQTGVFVITYDFGTDKIFPDYPKNSLSISSYPRIAVDIISDTSEALGFGNQQVATLTEYLLTTTTYATKTRKVRSVSDAIKTAMMTAQNSFFNFKITLPQAGSRIVLSDNTKGEIFQKTRDFISSTNVERI